MNYLREIDNLVSFFSDCQFFDHLNYFDVLALPNVFNNKILLHFVSLGDSGLSYTNF